MKIKKVIPQSWVEKMDPKDRKQFGVKTKEEQIQAAEIKTERDLHNQINNLLRLRGIVFFSSRMDKRTTRPKGEPDYIFGVWTRFGKIKTDPVALRAQGPMPCAWEVKLPGKNLDPEQVEMFKRLSDWPNAFCCRVIRSVDDALRELKAMGL